VRGIRGNSSSVHNLDTALAKLCDISRNRAGGQKPPGTLAPVSVSSRKALEAPVISP